jgi:hypothetical protein
MTTEAMREEGRAALAKLKDFQRDTVEHVFERLFDPAGSRRFLVADEVGLGKTMIAKGVIARGIEHLRGKVGRIDVVYICSNGDIARQNLNRLAMKSAQWVPASRLTLLAKKAADFKEVNFVAFTPGTSFDVEGGLGHVEERVLLYQLLAPVWELGGAADLNLLAGYVEGLKFRRMIEAAGSLDSEQAARLRDELGANENLLLEFRAVAEHYPTHRSKPPLAIRKRRADLVGALRMALAKSCIAMLEPDIVILDEFQRFTHLLEDNSEAGQLARALFDWKDAHVLLLSATPYKMYAGAHEVDAQQHHGEFLKTLRFLERETTANQSQATLLDAYASAVERVADEGGEARLEEARHALEQRLCRVMVRTERLASTPDRNGMLKVAGPATDLQTGDVLDFLALQRVANAIGRNDSMVEYWKSAPFVLNFMDGAYKIKNEVSDGIEKGDGRTAIAKALSASRTSCLPFDRHDAFEPIEIHNGRFRELMADTLGRQAYRLLWLPPACPYYQLAGAFAEPSLRNFSKRLVFSAWRFVPRAIASLLSYEAERRMVGRAGAGLNTVDARKKRGRLLRFGRTAEGGPSAMSTLALLYPSSFLARACDPVRLASEASSGGGPPSIAEALGAATMQIEIALRRLPAGNDAGPVDDRWYWVAPLLLDATLEPEATRRWFEQPSLARLWAAQHDDDEADGGEESDVGPWELHVQRASDVVKSGAELGRRPADLAETLAQLALGAPGVVLLRSMLRVVNLRTDALGDEGGVKVRNGAAAAAWSFRTLFNQSEVVDLLRREYPPEAEDAYWRSVLAYSVDGCLQSVIDEYAHVLRDHLGITQGENAEKVHEIANEIVAALSLRTANIAVDDIGLSAAGRTVKPKPRRMRCHFALRFGDERDEDGEIQTRGDSVRKAFNSPFWPFVVATTSVGQEGLDFHTYCHTVVHWNLPSNPVDLEQREGRVHRFKGHAVRKNVATAHFADALAVDAIDPWEAMFAAAAQQRPADSSDIVPYWIYTVEGGAHIERRVLAHPLSRDVTRLHALLKSLTLYRMAFGQARQEDLVRYLQSRVPESDWARVASIAAINISPAAVRETEVG